MASFGKFISNNFKSILQIDSHLFKNVLFIAFCPYTYVEDMINKHKQTSLGSCYRKMME